jgi:hypothetical protein
MTKYWIVNEAYPYAKAAVEKIIDAETKDLPFVELTDLEYKTIGNPDAMLVISKERNK